MYYPARAGMWTWLWYRGGVGMWAWVLHRITGVGVVLFILLHILDTSVIGWGPEAYNWVVNLFKIPYFKVFEVMLIGAVLFHGLNGIRVILIDFFHVGTRIQRQLFWVVVCVFVVLFVAAAYFMVKPLFHG